MKLLILGAGASYGSDGKDTPPLGDDLFAALQSFNPPGWGTLPENVARYFQGDFEGGMVRLSTERPHALPPLQRAMAAFFFNFQPRTSSLYVSLANRVRTSNWGGAICTLNYERLLEISLSHVGIQPVIGLPATPGSSVELCLPHGCCHLFCDSVRGTAGAVSFSGMNVTTNGPVSVISDPQAFQDRINSDAFPPVMSYFEPSKRTTAGANFIDGQRLRFRELVNQATRISIVGIRVRPQDDHIWGPLTSTGAEILYCSGPEGQSEFDDWASNHRSGKEDIVVPEYFSGAFRQITDHLMM